MDHAGTLGFASRRWRVVDSIVVVTILASAANTQIPYNGGEQLYGIVRLKSVEETVSDWAVNKNGCTIGPTQTFRNGVAYCRTWTGCREGADVELCLLEGTPHCWPGSLCTEYPAPGSNDVNADDHMWDFFSRFELPLSDATTSTTVAAAAGER